MKRPVLITGCSSGIGFATATLLAERGVPVYATVRRAEDAERLSAIDGIEPFLCDVTDAAEVKQLREAIVGRGAGLWGIVHNAGIAHVAPMALTAEEALRAVFDVNVFAVHRVTNALLDLVSAARGRIVTISSLSGTQTARALGTYSMSKHAIEAYTDALAQELADRGVHVCAVVPGNFASAILENAVRRFEAPVGASEALQAFYAPGANVSRAEFPGPEAVAASCYAALYDDVPLPRYLVTSNEDEAHRMLEEALGDWARLNRSTPHRWSRAQLLAALDAIEGNG